jgi:hypothetical protein
MSEEGYTTIFHPPGEDGVMIHKKGTITITTSEPPVLTGGKSNAAKLWTIGAPKEIDYKEEAERIQLTFHPTLDKISPRRSRIPNESNMVRRDQSRKLRHMAGTHHDSGQETFPRLGRNTTRTHEKTMSGSTIYETANRRRTTHHSDHEENA